MTINLQKPDITELKPRITVFGVGGGGGNAVNNMITAGLAGVDFVVANTDAQALTMSKSERIIQLGVAVTEGLGAGSQPEIGAAAAEECFDEINDHLNGTHMCFVTAGMGGGTGTGAAPVVAKAARQKGILTVGVVTKPFHFEGQRRMRLADQGIEELQKNVDTLIVIPNQNLFRIANENTTFADAFSMADQVLYSGVACITDLMVKEGLINLDFADVRSVMREMGKAMMGTGEASGDGRAMAAAEAAIANPLLDETSMRGAQGLLISITGGRDMTLFEVDEAATRIREEVDPEANIILGATFDESLEGLIRVSVVATGIDGTAAHMSAPTEAQMRPAVDAMRAQLKGASQSAPHITGSVAGTSAGAEMVAQSHVAPALGDAVQPSSMPNTVAEQPIIQPKSAEEPVLKLSQPTALTEADIERELSLASAAEMSEPKNRLFSDENIVEQPSNLSAAIKASFEAEKGAAPVMSGADTLAPAQSMPQAPLLNEPLDQQSHISARQSASNMHEAAKASSMPQIEDFPAAVQAELNDLQPQKGAQANSGAVEDKGAMGLLKRISTSLGMGDEDTSVAAQRAIEQNAPQPRRPLQQDGLNQPASQGQLDGQGRAPVEPKLPKPDDELEIPAFLRRQGR